MLFRGTGLLCTATICQALAQRANGQVEATSPTPSPSPQLFEVQPDDKITVRQRIFKLPT
jgi:hypothetical protein